MSIFLFIVRCSQTMMSRITSVYLAKIDIILAYVCNCNTECEMLYFSC